MHKKLLDIIKYKTGGRKKDFAEFMGWSNPYLTKLLSGTNFGLTPIVEILKKIPEIDANWFLKDAPEMITTEKQIAIRSEVIEKVFAILELQMFIPVMNATELHSFLNSVNLGVFPLGPEIINEWSERLNERNEIQNDIRNKVEKAILESKKVL